MGFFDDLGAALGGNAPSPQEDVARLPEDRKPGLATEEEFQAAIDAARKRTPLSRVSEGFQLLGSVIDPGGSVSDVSDKFKAEKKAAVDDAIKRIQQRDERFTAGEEREQRKIQESRATSEFATEQIGRIRAEDINRDKSDAESDVSIIARKTLIDTFPEQAMLFPASLSAADLESQGFNIAELLKGALTDDRKVEAARLLAESKEKLEKTKAAAKPKVVPEAEKVSQRELAKKFENFRDLGGTAQFESNNRAIDSVIDELKEAEGETFQSVSGNIVGNLPDFFRTDRGLSTQQKINKVVLASLRQTLGAQFTENEGTRVLKLTFDPTLEPSVNLKKLENFQREQNEIINNKLIGFRRLDKSITKGIDLFTLGGKPIVETGTVAETVVDFNDLPE